MNNRKDFLEWMRRKKSVSAFESRKILWQLDALNNVAKIFSIAHIEELPKSNSSEMELYVEFLIDKYPQNQNIACAESNHGTANSEEPSKEQVVSEESDGQLDLRENESIHRQPNTDLVVNVTNDDDGFGFSDQVDGTVCTLEPEETEKRLEELNSAEESLDTIAEEEIIDYEAFKNFPVSDHDKKLLDSDYIQKKKAYHRLKKVSFKLLSDAYVNAVAEVEIPSKQNSFCREGHQAPNLIFDVVSGQVADLNDGAINDMVSYVSYCSEEKEKKFIRNNHAFYYSSNLPKQESTAVAFRKTNPSLDVIQRSISATIKREKCVNDGTKLICLVPDNLGDFRDTIKSQIRSSSSNVIQIPRSIATVYSFAKQYDLEQDTSFVCYDYDSSDLCRTEIRVQYNEENGQYEFIRMRRQRLFGKDHYNFDKVATDYLKAYAEKYQVKIPQNIAQTLIDTRDILKILSKGQAIPVEVDGTYYTIDYDRSLVDTIASAIMDEINADDYELDYCCALLDINTSINGFCTLNYLLEGCREIQDRIANHEVIWREYLPELSLEVIRDGTFDNLKLIDKGMIQSISETTMEEEVVIPLSDGRFSLPIGKGKVFCPLVREEFGNRQRDKMAMFDDVQIAELKKAVGGETSSVPVDLTLTYHYGDPDSYRLTAVPCNSSEIQIQSQWCDEEDQIMGNDKYPEYGSPIIKYPAGMNEVNRALQDTIKRFSNSHNYTMAGGYQGKPPFDEYGHWLALKQISKVRLSLPHIFSPETISECDNYTVSIAEEFLDSALSIYRGCEKGTLDSGNIYYPCDLDKPSLSKIKAGLLDIMSLMGGVCVTSGMFEQAIIDDMVDCILGSRNLQYILPLSTYISRDDDYYGVWNIIDALLEVASGESLRHAIRSISAVCWRDSTWIYQLGVCPDHVLQSMIDTIIAVCRSEVDKVYSDYNPRKVRDMLEAFLGISRLKETNPKVLELLDCNNRNIKSFVVLLKELNEVMRHAKGSLKYPFVSRLVMEVPDELRNVSNVLYPIIEILTDGNAIKLTGFAED